MTFAQWKAEFLRQFKARTGRVFEGVQILRRYYACNYTPEAAVYEEITR